MRNATLMLNTSQPPVVAQGLSGPPKAKVLAVTLFILGLMLAFALPARAQEIPDWAAPGEQAATDQRTLPDANEQEIPNWAAPGEQAVTDYQTLLKASEEVQGPPPFPTPLDPAGLAWLAVAGGALAARRLRQVT